MRIGRPSRRISPLAIPLGCVAAAIAMILAGQVITGKGQIPPASERETEGGALDGEEDAAGVDGPDADRSQPKGSAAGDGVLSDGSGGSANDEVLENARKLMDAPVRESSLRTFLDDLSAGKADGKAVDGGGTATKVVHWAERGDIPAAAEGVLRAYVDAGDAELTTSGYLDMHGNVWAAIVRGGDAWCDVVLVSTEDREESSVRVARVFAGAV